MEKQRLHYLLEQFNNDVASASEVDELVLFIRTHPDPELFSTVVGAQITEYTANASDKEQFQAFAGIADEVLAVQSVLSKDESPIKGSALSMPFLRWWAAASIILLSVIGGYFWMNNKSNTENSALTQTTVDKAPGRDGAILTLADGKQVVLDSLENGLIAHQNGVNVLLNNGLIAYDITGKSNQTAEYNTITTPNGRQFSLVLQDGTKVWLNAASSIRYPTVFNEGERKVEVTGEVYLEVAADKSKPFLVAAGAMVVQVLGTRFNINAYKDEPAIKTTLLDGSIKVYKNREAGAGLILKPGQQAIVNEHITLQQTVNLEQILAWKNGVFNLNGATLEEFMRQIARWYDLTVIYKGAIPYEVFKGKIGRDLQLSQILKVLTQFNINYELSGKTITIKPQ